MKMLKSILTKYCNVKTHSTDNTSDINTLLNMDKKKLVSLPWNPTIVANDIVRPTNMLMKIVNSKTIQLQGILDSFTLLDMAFS